MSVKILMQLHIQIELKKEKLRIQMLQNYHGLQCY